jgi:dihydrofolate reductase
MGKIVVTEYVSVDGVVEAPGGGEGFKHAGWSFQYKRGQEGDRFKFDEAVGAAALLLGRVTYEGFAAAWPAVQGEFGDRFNGMPKYVVSATLEEATWNNSTIVRDVAGVRRLKETLQGDLVVHGSPTLVQALFENDLVDELRLMIYPLVLGTGKRLFAEVSDKIRLQLKDTKGLGDGVMLLVYTRATGG